MKKIILFIDLSNNYTKQRIIQQIAFNQIHLDHIIMNNWPLRPTWKNVHKKIATPHQNDTHTETTFQLAIEMLLF